MRLLFLLILISLSIGATQAVGAQTVYDLKGKVYGPDGKPMPNVLVTLENNARARIGQETTNSDGRYEFADIAAGTYYITVKPDESRYQPAFQTIELLNTSIGGRSFTTETVDFTLKATSRPSAAPGTVFAQPVPPEAEKQYLAAIKSLNKGDRDHAISGLRKAIEIFPTYFYALAQLGAVFVEEQKYEEALEPLKKAITINPKAGQSHLALGIALINLDRPADAISELTLAHQIDSKSFRADLYLGMAQLAMEQYDTAEKSLKDALAIGGVEARSAHLYLASLYDKRKQYQLAINELETYLKENPKAANANSIKEAIKKLKAKSP